MWFDEVTNETQWPTVSPSILSLASGRRLGLYSVKEYDPHSFFFIVRDAETAEDED